MLTLTDKEKKDGYVIIPEFKQGPAPVRIIYQSKDFIVEEKNNNIRYYHHNKYVSGSWSDESFINVKDSNNLSVFWYHTKTTAGCCGSTQIYNFNASNNGRKLIREGGLPDELISSLIKHLINRFHVTQVLAQDMSLGAHKSEFTLFLEALDFKKLGETFYNPNSKNYVQNWQYLDEYRNNEDNFNEDDEDGW